MMRRLFMPLSELVTLFSCRLLRPLVRVVPFLIVLLMVISCTEAVRFPARGIGKGAVPLAEAKFNKISNQPAHLNKNDFFTLMRPVIEAESARILQTRRHLLRLKSSARLQEPEVVWVRQIATEYHVPFNGKPDPRFWQQLLARVDIVPLEMALAQAANESAWGNSRFARDANNYFGHWCFKKGCGLVPLRRRAGARHEIQRFDSRASSVRAYMKNMNTGRAYQQLRTMRQSMRHQGQTLDAELLALGLRKYSERGAEYVKSIRSIIRKNRTLMRKS